MDVWSRRGVFVVAGQVFAGATLGLALDRYAQAQSPEGYDWKRLFASRPEGGTGRVKQIEGIAFADRRSLAVGATVRSGEQLRVAKGGRLVVSIEDGTLLWIRGGSVLDFGPSARKTGVLNLVAGALLTVMPTSNRYLVSGPTAAIGIKGTVFYRQVFEEDERTAVAMDGRTVTVPGKGVRDYFCTCNGSVDYLHMTDRSFVTSDTAQHHHAYILNPDMPGMLVKFDVINHTDRDIQAAIDLQDGPKHDARWLRP
jgi:hypothetical protein